MRHRIICAVAAALLTTATFGADPLFAQETTGLEGVWVFTSADESNQRGAFMFTSSSYSMMYVRGDQPRALMSETPTDAEGLAAFGSITANMGRYSLEGDQITYEAYMANSPNYMDGWPENSQTATVVVDGDMLTWTAANGTVFSMRRVE